jgi:RNA polymerase sigma factor (sigma-70 family)
MKNWKENRNYRRIKDESGAVIANIITVDGIDVEVTSEVFLAYSQSDRRERYIAEELEPGKLLSLDKLREDEVPLGELGVEQEPSAESVLLLWADNQEKAVQKARLTAMLSELDEEEKGLIQALFFEGVSAREYARRLGVYHRTVIYRRDKLLEKLRRKIFS